MRHMKNIPNQSELRINSRFAVRVFVVGIIFSITAMLVSLDMFKEYKSTVIILVVPKSQVVATQSEAVVQNIIEFPKTLAFYERLLKFNPEIKDGFAKMSPIEKKEAWNGQIEVSKNNSRKGSIIELPVSARPPAQAEALSQKTANTLFNVVSNFYDIKTDIGISIIDGPFTSAVLKNWFLIIPLSILIGFATSLLLNLLLDSLEKVFKPGTYSFKKSPLAGLKNKFNAPMEEKSLPLTEEEFVQDIPYHFEDISKKPIQEEEKKTADFDKSLYPNFPEMPKTPAKNASAPSNLPIAETNFIFGEPEENIVEEQQDFIEMKKEEPSLEEMKERLNKLLKGDM